MFPFYFIPFRFALHNRMILPFLCHADTDHYNLYELAWSTNQVDYCYNKAQSLHCHDDIIILAASQDKTNLTSYFWCLSGFISMQK